MKIKQIMPADNWWVMRTEDVECMEYERVVLFALINRNDNDCIVPLDKYVVEDGIYDFYIDFNFLLKYSITQPVNELD